MAALVNSVLGLTSADIDALATALGLSGTNKGVISMTFSDDEWKNNQKIRESVAYIGFDAKRIVAQFFKKAAENPIAADDQMQKVGDISIYEKNDAKTDLMFFLNVFLERGNNLSKALLRCDDVIAPTLKRKAAAYGIMTEQVQNKTILGTRHLTLARLAQAFAHCTAVIILKDKIKSKLNSKLFSNLPILMGHTVFPALIPQNVQGVSDELREMAILINVEMSMMLADPKLKRKMAVQPLEDLCGQSQQYVDAAMNGSLLEDAPRAQIMIKAGILKMADGAFEFTDTMLTLVDRLSKVRRVQMHTLTNAVTRLGN